MSIHDIVAFTVIGFMAASVGYQLYMGYRFLRGKMSIQEMLESHYLIDRD